jgi:hypothetical protein
MLEH